MCNEFSPKSVKRRMCACVNSAKEERTEREERERPKTASVVSKGEHTLAMRKRPNENFILFSAMLHPLTRLDSFIHLSLALSHTHLYSAHITGATGWSTIINQTHPTLAANVVVLYSLHDMWTCAQTNKWINERMKKRHETERNVAQQQPQQQMQKFGRRLNDGIKPTWE